MGLRLNVSISTKYVIVIATIIIIIALWFVFSGSFVNYDDFAKCLTENGATMYGTVWCGHCNNQKDMFGDSVPMFNNKNEMNGLIKYYLKNEKERKEKSIKALEFVKNKNFKNTVKKIVDVLIEKGICKIK